MNKIIILDANALVHRFYHALPPFTNQAGLPTQAVYGLTNVILRILDEFKPKQIFACFDRPEITEREKVYQAYKATRPKTPTDLRLQLTLAKKLLEKFNIPVFEQTGYEADDLIGSISQKLQDRGRVQSATQASAEFQVIIVTGDLDTLQLVVDDQIIVYLLKKGLSQVTIYNEEAVRQRFGLAPQTLPDFKALMGDQSDNIKGIPGVGEKKGAALIQQFGSVENLIKNIQSLPEQRIKEEISRQPDRLLLNKQLTTINRRLSVRLPEEDYRQPDLDQLRPFLQELNFKTIIERLSKQKLTTSPEAGVIKTEIKFQLPSKQFEEKSEASPTLERRGGFTLKTFSRPPDHGGSGKFFSIFAQAEAIIFLLFDENIYIKTEEVYKTPFQLELIKKIIAAPCPKVTFDFKNTLEQILSIDSLFDRQINFSQIFDLKIAARLAQPSSSNLDFVKFIGLQLGQVNEDKEQLIFEFLQQAQAWRQEWARKIEELQLSEIYKLEARLAPVLARMEQNGLWLNRDRLEEFKEFLAAKIKQLQNEIYRLAEEEFNINSTKDLRRILFVKLKISTKGLAKTPKGELSTQAQELEKLAGTHPLIEKLLSYRELHKIATTYTDSLKNQVNPKTGRLHTTFDPLGTATGRISSASPNLQNLPVKGELARQLRKCFQAPVGFSFLGLDYSQIELRLAAHFSQDENLLLAFAANIDIHSLTAKLLFKKDDERQRRLAKMINFGIIYGMSAQGLRERLRIGRGEAEQIISDYFAKFPGLKKMRDDFVAQAKQCGYAQTLFGRKRFLPEIQSQSYREVAAAARAAINTPIQGSNADILKKVLITIDDWLISEKFYPGQARLILQIYDSIILEVKEDIIDEVAAKIKEVMEDEVKLRVPLKVKIKTGKDLSEL